ncbi:hypothetical protein CcaverHIS002_0607120 [Cutaneotrichosporon cavernicola]|uniref:Hexosyltransferase n=1 Tax=Cutaneotrichosporon cavernicola TaxID=279322 RepID=A0AA48L946_9TREE|nr:uncharacterized protein CcaverHIS019_0606540 [Cutaneotrichosporon cavernicola]BEI86425.1 hypothetical protein CcaverHIS002_0607120 [Cutaneotrichosporon cavernicola]BEI94195.1 hypothetical protein CcaverHIS019_0606540 [Cutaneotrichosporon cavernicola]BEJ01975.1 hypothetical protein CcaverHIS631_0606570 [Cutaneotrichosporon cavernicola]
MSRRSPRAAPRNFPLSNMPLPVVASPTRTFRTSRLKALFGVGVIAVITLLLYAFHGHPAVRAATELAAKVAEDLQLPQENVKPLDVWREWDEPDFALLSSRPPHQIGCDVPLDGENAGTLVFLGIFSSAPARERRDLLRRLVIPDFPSDLFNIKFILGQQAPTEGLQPAERIAKAKFAKDVEEEMAEFGDMIILDIVDNIDDGKTHAYFKWIAAKFAGAGQVKGRPRFVMKADDDTLLIMPNVVSSFIDLDCSRNYYWGTSQGSASSFGYYFRGLAYALSWPVASWLGNADITLAHASRTEDARTGQWLSTLDDTTDPLIPLDYGWNMGDWNQLFVTVDTVALHWLKQDEWFEEQTERMHNVWKEAGRPYEASNGIARHISIEGGKKKPDPVAVENQRERDNVMVAR